MVVDQMHVADGVGKNCTRTKKTGSARAPAPACCAFWRAPRFWAGRQGLCLSSLSEHLVLRTSTKAPRSSRYTSASMTSMP